MAEDDKTTDTKTEEQPVEKKGRGRPKKPESEKKQKNASSTGKRGRPPKPESEKKQKVKKEKGKRGRPKSADSGKPKTHPPVAEMVTTAVAALKDRRGCSLSAVKKYISANYEVDMERQAIFIRRYVRKAIDDGKLVLVKGTSSTGSFKLADASDAKKATKTAKSSKSSPGKRGRPKGSKNKTPIKTKPKAKAEKKKATPTKPKGTGKRGRPKGSTKKKKSAA